MLKSLYLTLLVNLASLVGCSAGGTSIGVPITVSLRPGWSHTLLQGQMLGIAATVLNDESNSGVKWKLSGIGMLFNETTTSVVYIAPYGVTSDQKPMVIATSIANPDSTATLQIIVLAPSRSQARR